MVPTILCTALADMYLSSARSNGLTFDLGTSIIYALTYVAIYLGCSTMSYLSRLSFWEFQREVARVKDLSKKAKELKDANTNLQEDVKFQRQMHRNELKAMRRHLKAMTEAEKKVVEKYRIPYGQLEVDQAVSSSQRRCSAIDDDSETDVTRQTLFPPCVISADVRRSRKGHARHRPPRHHLWRARRGQDPSCQLKLCEFRRDAGTLLQRDQADRPASPREHVSVVQHVCLFLEPTLRQLATHAQSPSRQRRLHGRLLARAILGQNRKFCRHGHCRRARRLQLDDLPGTRNGGSR